jgi:hypothetical protein
MASLMSGGKKIADLDLGDAVEGVVAAIDYVIESQVGEEESWRMEGFVNALRELRTLKQVFASALKKETELETAQ